MAVFSVLGYISCTVPVAIHCFSFVHLSVECRCRVVKYRLRTSSVSNADSRYIVDETSSIDRLSN